MNELSLPEPRLPEQTTPIDPLFLSANPQWKEARSLVDSNPTDLTHWNTLIAETESLVLKYTPMTPEVKSVIERTFDELLTRFPLFFGYWKKYTSIQYQINGLEASMSTLSRSLDSFPYSVELWIDYLNLLISNYLKTDKAKVRLNFQIAQKFIGCGFLSHEFWDKYLEFESNDDQVSYMKVLLYVIKLPLHQYARYYQKFLEVSENFDVDLLCELQGEALVIPQEIKNDEEKKKLYVKEYFNNVFLKTQGYVAEVWPFESNIKQSYFNLQAVSTEEEENWINYLDFQTNKYKAESTPLIKSLVISTFERSLIPNALNVNFWKKYLQWYTSIFPEDFSEINSIYRKSCNLYIDTKIYGIRLNYALFLQLNKQETDLIHELYLATIKHNPLEFKPIVQYIKFLARTNGYDAVVKNLEDIFNNYHQLNSNTTEYRPVNDPYMKRLYALLNDKTIGVILTETLKIHWICLKSPNTARAGFLKNIYNKRAKLESCVPFQVLAYKFFKSQRDHKQLSRIVKTMKYEATLPIGILTAILKDHQSYIRSNPNNIKIYNPYIDSLSHTLEIHNPMEASRLTEENEKNRKREWGHPGVLKDTPEITNTDPYGIVSHHTVKGVPLFKNVEKAAQAAEYLPNE